VQGKTKTQGGSPGMCLKPVHSSVWLLTAALAVACGSETPEPGVNTAENHGVSYIGYINMAENSASGRTTMDAGFSVLNTAASDDDASLPRPLQQNPCLVSHLSAFDNLVDSAPLSRLLPVLPKRDLQGTISAGEFIRVSAGEKTVATLRRTSTDDVTVYSTETQWINDVSPDPLVISISGDTFPAMQAVEVPAVMPLTLEAPQFPEVVTPSTTFHWVTGTADNQDKAVSVVLIASAVNINTAIATSVICTVDDTGSYTFSNRIREQLGPGFSSPNYHGFRQAVRVYNTEQSSLVITRISEG